MSTDSDDRPSPRSGAGGGTAVPADAVPASPRALEQDALRGTNAGVWEWNIQTGETRFDDRWAEIVGYTLTELEPVSIETWTRLAHPDDLVGSGAVLDRVFAREIEFYDFEARMRHRDGRWIWVHDRGRVVEWTADARPLRMIGTHTDITARKRAEHALLESRQFYHAIFEKSGVVKLLLDPDDGSIVDANPTACAFYGYDRWKMQSMHLRELNPMPEAEIREALEAARTERAGRFEFRHRIATGELRDVEVFSTPVTQGDRVLLYVIVYDVTERLRAETDRLALERQLQRAQKSESLARMAGAVAHRFNNQLQAVLGNLELTRLAIDGGEDVRGRLDEALHVTQVASRLCDLMLTYLGQKQGRRERLVAAEFCRARLDHFRSAFREGVTLEFAEPASSPSIDADPGHLQALLEQLLANAAESRETGPVRVTLAVGRVTAADLPRQGRYPFDFQPTDSSYACISVSDDGPGIADEHMEQLFDPFFSTKFTGRGMGLPVVLGLVRTSGGAVIVERPHSGGVVMRVCLPAVE